MQPLAITDYTLVSALGRGRAATLDALREARCGLARQPFEGHALDTFTGPVAGLDAVALPPALRAFDGRYGRLVHLGLESDDFAASVARAASRWGAARVGVFLGTSTSGIVSTESAYRRRDAQGALPADFDYVHTHDLHSGAELVRRALALRGPAHGVSTACSSGAKVFGSAARLIALGLIDAAVVGGVDTLCLTTLYGFRSLELLSNEVCRPWDAERRGLSIGEAAGFALVERDGPARPPAQAWLLGVGETSDGHHMSSPHPEGAGAALAMREALAQAGLAPGAVDYINLHGTGTPSNDAAEDLAVGSVFGTTTPCSSTKGATGHTLGAAGALEAAISMLALQHGLMPGGIGRQQPDPALRCHYLTEPRPAALRVVASNSFGFGGSNACLLFGAAR